ncbi:MAG: hypothetical protein LJE90_01520, partial [Betaproteobacteria bacterium]|nr:hypothetical protein [Betaproteobacteria bacterium]
MRRFSAGVALAGVVTGAAVGAPAGGVTLVWVAAAADSLAAVAAGTVGAGAVVALGTVLEALVRGSHPVSAPTPAADTVMTEMAAAAISGCSRGLLLVSMAPS